MVEHYMQLETKKIAGSAEPTLVLPRSAIPLKVLCRLTRRLWHTFKQVEST
jgi:hypothetical protein